MVAEAELIHVVGATCTVESPALAPPRRWRLADRLGEKIIRDLLRDSRSGVPKRVLAERYGVSLSSVKRMLRTGK